MEIKHEEHKKKGVFYIEENGERIGDLEYFDSGPGEITIYHTGVNEKFRGHHIGDKLVTAAVNYAREKNLKIVPTCSFAKKVIDSTPEFQDVMAHT